MSDELLQLLTAYVDGELSSRQRRTVARLLKKSREARHLLRRLQADRDALRSTERLGLGDDFAARIVSLLTPRSTKPVAAKANVWSTWLPAAAAAAIVIGIGIGTSVLLNDLLRGKRDQGPPIAKSQDKTGEEVAVVKPIPAVPSPREAERGTELAKNVAPTQRDLDRVREALDTLLQPLLDGTRQLTPKDAPNLALLPSLGRSNGGPSSDLPFTGPPILTARPLAPASAFKTLDFKLALFLDPRNLDTTKLAERLKQDSVHHVDLSCLESWKTFERLQAACRTAGVRLIVDPELNQRLSKKQPTAVMVYLENTSPDLVLKLMQALKAEEVKAESKRKGDGQIDSIMVQPLDEAGRKRLAESLGVAPATLTPVPADMASPGLDPTKPLSDSTLKSLEKLASKGKELTAIALIYYPNRSRIPPSKELKQFQDSRLGLQAGAIHVVFFLRPSRG